MNTHAHTRPQTHTNSHTHACVRTRIRTKERKTTLLKLQGCGALNNAINMLPVEAKPSRIARS